MRISRLMMVAGLVLGGCTVGPDYHPPKVEVPAQWSRPLAATQPAPTGAATQPAATQPAGTQPVAMVDLAHWWSAFHDPELDHLVAEALAANPDLAMAVARIREARAARGVVKADSFPTLDATGSYSHILVPQSVLPQLPTSGSSGGSGGSGGSSSASLFVFFPTQTDLYQVGFDAAWEIDVFGRIRRNVEAATDDLQAMEENRRDIQVTLLAEVGRDYIELRGMQQRLAITRDNVKAQGEALDLSQQRFRAGVTTELDVTQAQALLAATRAGLPALERDLAKEVHQLSVLLGKQPDALAAELAPPRDIPPSHGEAARVPLGLPSDLLRRRPDIRTAERQLAAATARIGVATADLYPRFMLNGDAGFESFRASTLIDSRSAMYSVGPSVSWPVFEGGKIKANIAVQDAREAQALIAYRRVILAAMQDVEDALVSYDKEQGRHESLAQAVAANRRSVLLAQRQYSAGTNTFLPVLDAERSLYQAQDQLVQSQRDQTEQLIALYKALGGGWE